MKLDLFKKQWIDIVFEGRNQSYGAYELRITNPKTLIKSLTIGAVLFAFLVSIPVLISLIPEKEDDIDTLDDKIVTVDLNNKPKDKPKDILAPPPPPPPAQQAVQKFVKPEVAKAEDVVEDPPKIEDLKGKDIGSKTVEGDADAAPTIDTGGDGPKGVVEESSNEIYMAAAISVKPDFPGGIDKFYKFIARNYQVPEDGLKGKIFVQFVVEKDGSLTDIKVLRDIGYGTGKEAIRVLKSCPRWTPGEWNGKKVRVLYSLPIVIQSPE